jgi:GntR family transcriptional regulator
MSVSTAGAAPFERVAQSIRADIRCGNLSPGDKLPSHRELAATHGVALATAQKALRALQNEGWVVARQSIGVFVSEARDDRDEPITIGSLAQQVQALASTVGDLRTRLERIESQRPPV